MTASPTSNLADKNLSHCDLAAAVEAAQSGNRPLARFYLEQLIQSDPRNAVAWLWFAWVADSPTAAVSALQTARQHGLDSSLVNQGLAWARAMRQFVLETGSDDHFSVASASSTEQLIPSSQVGWEQARRQDFAADTAHEAPQFVPDEEYMSPFGHRDTPETQTLADIHQRLDSVCENITSDLWTEEQDEFDNDPDGSTSSDEPPVSNGLNTDRWQAAPCHTLVFERESPQASDSPETTTLPPFTKSAADRTAAYRPFTPPPTCQTLVFDRTTTPSDESPSSAAESTSDGAKACGDEPRELLPNPTVTHTQLLHDESMERTSPVPECATEQMQGQLDSENVQGTRAFTTPLDGTGRGRTEQYDVLTRTPTIQFGSSIAESTDDEELGSAHTDVDSNVDPISPELEEFFLGIPASSSAPVSASNAKGSVSIGQAWPRSNPISRSGHADIPAIVPGTTAQRTRPTILAVDDSPTIRSLVAICLEKCGYHVITATDGMDALQPIKTHRPVLILTDIDMPRLNGYQLCKLVKRDPSTSSIPVIMLSGKDGVFDKFRGRRCGCDDYLTKPFEAAELQQRVAQYLGAHAS